MKSNGCMIRHIKHILLLGAYKRISDSEQARKLVLVNTITLFSIVILIAIGSFALAEDNVIEGILDYIAAVVLLICITVLRRSKSYMPSLYTGIGVMTLLYGYLFFSGTAGTNGALWYYTYPVFSLYLLGKRRGAVANLILFLPSFIFLLVIWPQSDPLYSRDFTIRFIPSLFCVFIYSYLFEATRLKTHRQLQIHKSELETTIADLQEKETQLKRAHEDLETQVEERTKALRESNEALKNECIERQRSQERQKALEAQLVSAKKMEALGTLAGGVAHDLNNILSGVTSYPELIMMSLPKEDPIRKPLETIRTSGKKAATIVQDLLTLSRRGAAEFKTVDLQQVVEGYLKSPEFVKMNSFHHDIKLLKWFGTGPYTISGSAVHLGKTIMNLITNAAEAMPDGGDIWIALNHITVEAEGDKWPQLKPGAYVKMSVADSGTGIPLDVIDRIFEPFFTTKKMGRSGTGLGMAVVWGTVQDHHGHIEVQSSSKGTRFDLYFPAVRPKEKEMHAPPEKIPHGNHESVLLVDDEPLQREIASSILKALGYQVHCVTSGEAAIDYLHKQDADLIVMDMTMDPGMNGHDTLRHIFEFKPDQKAIITSGFAESNLVQNTLQMGARAYLKKPYSIEDIAKALNNTLAN